MPKNYCNLIYWAKNPIEKNRTIGCSNPKLKKNEGHLHCRNVTIVILVTQIASNQNFMAELHLTTIALFFVYGLAFFSMGVAIALEVGRSPTLGEARVLRPLAAFGIIHGLHEWYELILLQADWQAIELPIVFFLSELVC